MKWPCTLLQRWLPEYPDGDLPAFWKARLTGHLRVCPGCRREHAALHQVAADFEAAALPDRGEEFWTEFSRELHLKLVHAARELPEPAPRITPGWRRLPYLIGVPALAVLLLWVAVHTTGPRRITPAPAPPLEAQAPKAAEPAKVATAMPAAAPAAPEGFEQFIQVSLTEGESMTGEIEDVDLSGWDLDAEFAGMTDQEKEHFLKTLHQHQKDGSWVARFSPFSWA